MLLAMKTVGEYSRRFAQMLSADLSHVAIPARAPSAQLLWLGYSHTKRTAHVSSAERIASPRTWRLSPKARSITGRLLDRQTEVG